MEGLENYRSQIEGRAKPCLLGRVSKEERPSFCGGLPLVDPGFVWPSKNQMPLHFVAQIACEDVPGWPQNEGALLFFYDDSHWGLSPGDQGHAQVIWQRGERRLTPEELPRVEKKKLLGLMKAVVKPRTYKQVFLRFEEGRSYPGVERLGFEFEDEAEEELYFEFLAEQESPVQFGGYPRPIQSDDMEQLCANVFDLPAKNWELLLQLFEVGDQMWGDAGALYWFIPSADLANQCYDRVWMVTQCH